MDFFADAGTEPGPGMEVLEVAMIAGAGVGVGVGVNAALFELIGSSPVNLNVRPQTSPGWRYAMGVGPFLLPGLPWKDGMAKGTRRGGGQRRGLVQ